MWSIHTNGNGNTHHLQTVLVTNALKKTFFAGIDAIVEGIYRHSHESIQI